MRTIDFTANLEKLISRIPGMFPFLETNEYGVANIVKATNGSQGCYGRVIADLKCPKFPNDETYYTCRNGKKISLSEGIHTYRSMIDVYYAAIRDKEWERYIDNNIIAIMAFIQTINKKKYTFNVGDIIPPDIYDKLSVKNKERCEVHRINEYKESFLAFMERGIGRVYVGLSEEKGTEEECGIKPKKYFPLAPDYIYLGEARTLYNKVFNLKKQLDFFEKHTKTCIEDRKYYKYAQEEFEMMNGRKLLSKLEELITMSENIAEEYFTYASGIPNLKFNIMLTNTIKDMGMVTPYIQEWVAGKRYYNGDVVYYSDEYGYGMTWECSLFDGREVKSGVKEDELGRYYIDGHYDEESEMIYFENGETYHFGGIKIETEKYWFPQSLNWVGENRYSTTEVSGSCNSHIRSLRKYSDYINSEDQPETPDEHSDWLWYYRLGVIVDKEIIYDDMGNMTLLYGKDKEYDSGETIFYPNGAQPIVNVEEIGSNIEEEYRVIEQFGDYEYGQTISDEEYEVLTDDEKIKCKKFVTNLAAWGDSIIDINAENYEEKGFGKLTFTYWMGAHLVASKDDKNGEWYSQDDDGNYKYYFNDFMIDTTSKYGKNRGVKYTETYIYYKADTYYTVLETFTYQGKKYSKYSKITQKNYENLTDEDKKKCKPNINSIWGLVKSEEFDKYIRGEFDKDSKTVKNAEEYKIKEKFEFSTRQNLYTYNLKIGNGIVNVPYLRTDFTTLVDISHVDVEKTPLVRYDYYNGVSFQPSVNKDVYVERGITQAYEKHIKFSEIKTFEDLERYANGGFFIMSQENLNV